MRNEAFTTCGAGGSVIVLAGHTRALGSRRVGVGNARRVEHGGGDLARKVPAKYLIKRDRVAKHAMHCGYERCTKEAASFFC